MSEVESLLLAIQPEILALRRDIADLRRTIHNGDQQPSGSARTAVVERPRYERPKLEKYGGMMEIVSNASAVLDPRRPPVAPPKKPSDPPRGDDDNQPRDPAGDSD